ncbi:ribosome silencing factor [Zongyangia hominis]|uniref:Ribosomal silencing factor RsfS n=1 Tax=Zongyangia hominis TaxID=2763677 RepID=A0A926IAM4_9FIRM|nr:ribosome silencing factor [Zongyangia hominis]MBC8569265.1 ribosome silencing factor [Zongyangia hominis]
MEPLALTKKVAKILDDKKAVDIKAIKIKDLSIIADYFIIATGTSTTQVKALADEVEYQLSQMGLEPNKTDGYQSSTWVVLDYYDVMVHVFCGDQREFYSLERLWADGEPVDLSDVVTG